MSTKHELCAAHLCPYRGKKVVRISSELNFTIHNSKSGQHWIKFCHFIKYKKKFALVKTVSEEMAAGISQI